MRRVAVVASAQTPHVRRRDDVTPAELVAPLVPEVLAAAGLDRRRIDYTSTASSDFLEGRPFSFGFALDSIGAVPSIEESHIEGDGAWAAYDAWVRIQAGDADTALVLAWGKSSEGSLPHVTNATLDPFWESPLGLDAVALAALQARAWMDRTAATEQDLARVAARARGLTSDTDPYVVEPLRRSFLPPPTDGACALILSADPGMRAQAWVAGVAHATDAASIGARDITDVPSARAALRTAAQMAGWSTVSLAELNAPFPHQVLMLKDALALGEAEIDPSGGALGANPLMATGLVRLAEASARVAGTGRRALAHSTAGHCLQANMVWLLEGA